MFSNLQKKSRAVGRRTNSPKVVLRHNAKGERIVDYQSHLLIARATLIYLAKHTWILAAVSPELRIGKKGAFTDFLIRACASHFRPCFAQGERAN